MSLLQRLAPFTQYLTIHAKHRTFLRQRETTSLFFSKAILLMATLPIVEKGNDVLERNYRLLSEGMLNSSRRIVFKGNNFIFCGKLQALKTKINN